MKIVALTLFVLCQFVLAEEPPRTNPIPVVVPRPEERGGTFVIPKTPERLPAPIEEPRDPIQVKLKEIEFRADYILPIGQLLYVVEEQRKLDEDFAARQRQSPNVRLQRPQLELPKEIRDFVQKYNTDQGFRETLLEKRGELNTIIKNLLDLPPHLFGKDIRLEFAADPDDGNNRILKIFDRESKKQLGSIRFDRTMRPVDHKRDDDNIKALAEATPDPHAGLKEDKNYDANVHKIASLAHLVYSDTYAGNDAISRKVTEGEIEQAIKDLFGIKFQDRHKSVLTQFTPRANHAYVANRRTWRHNSTLITILDKDSRKQIGVIGFHYLAPTTNDGKPTEVAVVNYRVSGTYNVMELFAPIREKIEKGELK